MQTKENQPRSPNLPFAGHKASDIKADRMMPISESGDIIDLIVKDHLPLKELIDVLKVEEGTRADKSGAYQEFSILLKRHAEAEQASLYVQMKEYEGLKREAFEGDTEHAIADQLMAEIHASPDDNEWHAKVKVLAELVEKHIREEEEVFLRDVKEQVQESDRRAIGEEYIRWTTDFDLLASPKDQAEIPPADKSQLN